MSLDYPSTAALTCCTSSRRLVDRQLPWEEAICRERSVAFCTRCKTEVSSVCEILVRVSDERYTLMRNLGVIKGYN